MTASGSRKNSSAVWWFHHQGDTVKGGNVISRKSNFGSQRNSRQGAIMQWGGREGEWYSVGSDEVAHGASLVAMDLLEGQRSSAYGDQLWGSCMVPRNTAPNCSIAARRPEWKFE